MFKKNRDMYYWEPWAHRKYCEECERLERDHDLNWPDKTVCPQCGNEEIKTAIGRSCFSDCWAGVGLGYKGHEIKVDGCDIKKRGEEMKSNKESNAKTLKANFLIVTCLVFIGAVIIFLVIKGMDHALTDPNDCTFQEGEKVIFRIAGEKAQIIDIANYGTDPCMYHIRTESGKTLHHVKEFEVGRI